MGFVLVALFGLLVAQGLDNPILASDNLLASSGWGISYFNFASVTKYQEFDRVDAFSIYQYIAFQKRLSWDKRLSFRIPYSIQTAGYSGNVFYPSYRSSFHDFHIVWNHFDALELPQEWDLHYALYFYFPTSPMSQRRGWLMRYRLWLTLEQQFSHRLRWGIWWQPEYFVNTKRAYENSFEFIDPNGQWISGTNIRQNVRWTQRLTGVTQYAIRRSLSWQLGLGIEQTQFEQSQFVRKPRNFESRIVWQTGFWIPVSSGLRLFTAFEMSPQDSIWPRFGKDPVQIQLLTFLNLF